MGTKSAEGAYQENRAKNLAKQASGQENLLVLMPRKSLIA